MDTPKFCRSSGRFQGHLGLQTSVLCLLSNFPLFPPFEQTKEVLKTNEFGFRTLMAYQTPGMGGKLITEGRESPERSPACRARHPWNRLDFCAEDRRVGSKRYHYELLVEQKPQPIPGPGSQHRRCPVGGGEGKGVGATTEDTGVRSPDLPRGRAQDSSPSPEGSAGRKRRAPGAPGPQAGTPLAVTPRRPAERADTRGQIRECGPARILPW